MDFKTLNSILSNSGHSEFIFKVGSLQLPNHFHITEVAKTQKDFVDCGGERRSETTCVLQTYVADDYDHRLSPAKLHSILQKAASLGIAPEHQVEVEVQGTTIETYSMSSEIEQNGQLVFHLIPKSTDCLTKDKCGLDILPATKSSCCDPADNCC